MVIVKIRKPINRTLGWRPYDEWLFVSNISIPANYARPAEYVTLGYPLDSYSKVKTEIGQVYIDDVEYDEEASLASCFSTEESWYIDIPTQKLYVHIDHEKRMEASQQRVLEIRGYSDDAVFYNAEGFVFEPRITGNITIKDKADRARFGKISLVTNTVTLDNQDGAFDYAFTEKVPGADVEYFFISDEDRRAGETTLTPLYTGYVKKQRITSSSFKLTVADKREKLNSKYPNAFFDATTYPNMEDKYIGDLIPEGYGVIYGVPAICTNGELTTGDVTYKYATDGTVLTTVYVEIDDVWTEVTPTATDATNCTFTLSSTDGRESSGRYRKAKVDCTLRSQTNPADILQDIILRNIGDPYNSEYFDTTTWATEKALLADVGYYIPKRIKFFEHVEILQNGSTLNFLFRINPSGLYTIKVDDIERAVSGTYDYLDNLNDARDADTDFENYATDVNIGYAQDQESEDYIIETVDTFKEETIDTYLIEQELDFDTLLNSQSDAQAKGDVILSDYKIARDLHKINVHGILPAPLLDVKTYDSSVYLKRQKIREYAGIVKIKISSYQYDFEKETTILEGYDITDITSKEAS